MSNPEFDEFENVDDLGDSLEESAEESLQDSLEESTEETLEESATAEASTETSAAQSSFTSRFGWMKNLTIYDAMLIASALSISLAIILMLAELLSFEGIFFQWRTSDAQVEPLKPL